MSKIIYLKQEVKLGEMIIYQGLAVEVTQALIDGNPDIFKVIDLDQSMKDKAKMDYPIGTVFNNGSGVQKVIGDTYYWSTVNKKITVPTDKYPEGGIIYHPIDGWAPILPYLFTSEDDVKIYGGMKTYLVRPDNIGVISSYYGLWNGDAKRKGYKYFYHKENALAYIRKLKEKTLDDYEEILAKSESSIIFSGNNSYPSIYSWIRDNEPKLYYTKILQLIADDLNDGWVADFTNYDEKWCISIKDIVHYTSLQIHGIVYFKEHGLAEKARDILGDKVKYLFN